MRIVIIEDELMTAEDLAEILLDMPVSVEVVKILGSVAESLEYFQHHPLPDLIFSDIQLGDGSSFDIFRRTTINVPVIFCTAYNSFGIEAFKNNGIDYVLKPFSKKTIKEAIDKYNSLRTRLVRATVDLEGLFQTLSANKSSSNRMSSLLVNWKDKIIPVRIADIALFCIEYKSTQLITHDNKKYFVSHTLDELEEICGERFFRANRQFLVNRDFISEALQHMPRKLLLKLSVENKHEIIISKNRVPEFLSWLRN